MSLYFHQIGDQLSALEYAQVCLKISGDINALREAGYGWTVLGHALAALGRLTEAEAAYRTAIKLRKNLGEITPAMESTAGLARTCLASGRLDEAKGFIHEILGYLEEGSLDGADEPARVYLTCYSILQASQDPQADEILGKANEFVMERANKIMDEDLRHSYLFQVPTHREIIRICQG
jgi:tetratricopeptide (TPR) repeat protein